ncbi:patatin-like phospholipase domain-containing protein 4 isoform X2 [Choloepus didactylus]|uniref:patatin-like phospholipase domain-containing protein 4 isoform X2 n=1 Tax=Choloepus didactylus TaxID=27675 RepID=UPI00189FB323|nr:patatin-like phospholipase domain-containing protein 4 isoform X2 [Choloepus didactylus]
MKHINLSFAACGFLGIYHLGAASALCRHGRKLLRAAQAFAGASAGSLASVLLTAPEKIEECTEFTYKLAEETRRLSFGAVTPSYDFMARLRGGMETVLPTNAHELAQNRLHVSITNTKTRKNHLVSHFSSREVLIKDPRAHGDVAATGGQRLLELGMLGFSPDSSMAFPRDLQGLTEGQLRPALPLCERPVTPFSGAAHLKLSF